MICEALSAALVARLEHDEEAAGVGRVGAAAAAESASRTPATSGSRSEHLAELALQAHHLLGRDVLRGLRQPGDQAGVLDREEALRNLRSTITTVSAMVAKNTRERDRLVAQHDVEGAPVAGEQRVEHRLDRAVEAAVLLGLRAA